jgi:Epoxide hydrolase N terminus
MSNPEAFPLVSTPIHVSDEVLDDLRIRLTLTRPPLDEGNGDRYYGVPESYLRELVAYWRDGHDWRKAEAAINAYENYQVSVAGVSVHFMRKPGRALRRSR